ncbi:type 4 fimbrial biogenesis protein PilO [Betaproteobacteria bacterium]|nr:type 4 fimbrial biogenesis protein PilO [Betaproteobacteria bacterium]GHU01346.1 type 4 fimbrial biogenesis protein PilO [Betaproteobacteria bacterium]GHU17327.1 type 4 fimbrial biogenesis protein PilO [Betaproteobacteria bacterium]
MSSADKKGGFSIQRLQDDFNGLDFNDPGVWPQAPKVVVYVVLIIAIVALGWYLDWDDQWQQRAQKEKEELTLRDQWITKKKLAVNLDEYKRQLAEIDRQFGALLKQLPEKAEIDILLADVNQAGLGRGLQFDLFRPAANMVRDFYTEIPVNIIVNGGYHDLGEFVADVAKMPRIVSITNVQLGLPNARGNTAIDASAGRLAMTAQAVTYRYLDDQEQAQQSAAAAAARRKK